MNTGTPENAEELAVSTAVQTAWRDVRDALAALFTPALISFLILLALRIGREWIMPLTGDTELERLSYDVVEAFFMTPYAIMVHRFILLGEKTMSYRIAPAERRFLRFFGWSLVLLVLYRVPAAVSAMLPSIKGFLLVVLGIPVIVVAIRAIVLFPAVAVDAPGANWRKAMADTSDHAWRIFLIMLGAVLSFIMVAITLIFVAGLTLWWIIGEAGTSSGAFRALGFLLATIGMLVGYTFAVVIASRLYQRIGFEVNERG
jgi:hypothetical protein